MSINHHLLAKTTTDVILANFKSAHWNCCGGIGTDFYRVGCESSFPSPDASFYDDKEKLMVSFEFKPPTESKRGILTGLGQSIAYLRNSNISYLVIPQKLEDFEIGRYMNDLFSFQINGVLPIGLIIYNNDNPTSIDLVHNINSLEKKTEFRPIATNRFWAKHIDLPIPLFHLILHCYYLKKTGQISEDAFAYCWNTHIAPRQVLRTLRATTITDVYGDVIKTVAGTKDIMFFEKKIAGIKKLTGPARGFAIKDLKKDSDTQYVGDNYFNSVKKNFVTFLKHIGMIDSTASLTEDGFKLYHLGLVNGPSSKTFFDYFTQKVLTIGHHLDLIFDLDNLFNRYRGIKSLKEIRKLMYDEYELKGMIKRNPNRMVGDETKVEFWKYEFILWKALGLIVPSKGKPEISFNWKKIIEICSLPEL